MFLRLDKISLFTGWMTAISTVGVVHAQSGNSSESKPIVPATHFHRPAAVPTLDCPPPVSLAAPNPAECETPVPADCPTGIKSCVLPSRPSRSKILIEQQTPQVIFQTVPSTSVRSPSILAGCSKPECLGQTAGLPAPSQPAGFPNQQYGNPSFVAGAPAPTMALTTVPVMSYQMQMVPTIGYQYQMVPLQQQTAGFAMQALPVQPQPTAGFAPQQQTAGLATEIGLGLTLLELLLRSPIANRVEQAVLNRIDPPKVCPDDAFREITRQLKAVNDRLSQDNPSISRNSNSKIDSELEALRNETAQALKEANATLKNVGGKLEEANRILREQQKTIDELRNK